MQVVECQVPAVSTAAVMAAAVGAELTSTAWLRRTLQKTGQIIERVQSPLPPLLTCGRWGGAA
jgi:hypothetical protein